MRYAIGRGEAGEHSVPMYLSTYNVFVPKGSDNVQWTEDLGSSAIAFDSPEDAAFAAERSWGLRVWHVVGIGDDFGHVALCSYCDARPIPLDVNGEGGPYCADCFERFYGPEGGADCWLDFS